MFEDTQSLEFNIKVKDENGFSASAKIDPKKKVPLTKIIFPDNTVIEVEKVIVCADAIEKLVEIGEIQKFGNYSMDEMYYPTFAYGAFSVEDLILIYKSMVSILRGLGVEMLEEDLEGTISNIMDSVRDELDEIIAKALFPC